MDARDFFPTTAWKAEDIDKGGYFLGTISGISIQELGETDRKPVMSFSDQEKDLILNKTNTNSLIALFGANTDQWIGQQVRVMRVSVQFRGKMVPGLRIDTEYVPHPATPPMTQAQADAAMTKEEDDDIPF